MKVLHKSQAVLLLISLLAFLGFLDSTYLTILHYQNTLPPCTIKGCETVLTSDYSQIGPIPVSLLGSVFYIAVMGLSILHLQKNPKSEIRNPKQSQNSNPKNSKNFDHSIFENLSLFRVSIFDIRIYVLLAFIGFLVSTVFFFIQWQILKAFCQYCLASEAISLFILTCSLILIKSKSIS